MLDALYKDKMDLFWNRFGRLVAKMGMTANDVTMAGFVLCTLNALLFAWHQNFLVFGVALGLIELLDNVDGAVARVTGQTSRYGSYLDASTDRYKEMFVFLALGHVTGWWMVCMLAVTGSLLVSYNHARAAMEGATGAADKDDIGLPDLFERFERIATLCAGLILTGFMPPDLLFGRSFLFYAICVIAIASHYTAMQRFLRRSEQIRLEEEPSALPVYEETTSTTTRS